MDGGEIGRFLVGQGHSPARPPPPPPQQQQQQYSELPQYPVNGWNSHVPIAPKSVLLAEPLASSQFPQFTPYSQYFQHPLAGHYSRSGALLTRRLPPRSRTGCWTCRTRKVKCDEQRPKCGQCIRLQHGCDYRPRLSFRDDTARVLERVPDVCTKGSVWDPKAKRFAANMGSVPSMARCLPTLPPFSSLYNDEDRELKAIGKKPGTYNLICNPESFINTAGPGSDDACCPTAACTTYVPKSPYLVIEPLEKVTKKKEEPIPRLNGFSEDSGQSSPNAVIVSRFEEPIRRRTIAFRGGRDIASYPQDPASSQLPNTTDQAAGYGPSPSRSGSTCPTRYWEHWKGVISPRLMSINCDILEIGSGFSASLQMENVFEREIGESFDHCPLAQAVMALSAVSRNPGAGGPVDSLQYYQAAIANLGTSLKSNEDLRSDKAFLCHFILLIFEVVAAEGQRRILWEHHLSQLLSLVLVRAGVQGLEPYPFLVWYIAVIDTNTALSAGGEGSFMISAYEQGLLPEAEEMMPPLPIRGGPEEVNHFKSVFIASVRANQRIHYLAATVARLSRKLSVSSPRFAKLEGGGLDLGNADFEIAELVLDLKSYWESEYPSFMKYGTETSPEISVPGVRKYGEQATTLYHASIIYCHTSMYPSQGISLGPGQLQDIDDATEAILAIARDMIREGRCAEGNFLIFPLFLAGYAASSANLKNCVTQSLAVMAGFFVGHNIGIFKQMLLEIYQEQEDLKLISVSGFGVDWKDYMSKRNCRVINFAF